MGMKVLIIDKKKSKGLCVAYRCGRKPHTKDRFCPKHSKRYQKEENPIEYTFAALKQNAKRRGKDFSLTIDQFKQFCRETDYIELKGKLGSSASIDRVKPDKGYSLDNIQILSLSQNSSKGVGNCPF